MWYVKFRFVSKKNPRYFANFEYSIVWLPIISFWGAWNFLFLWKKSATVLDRTKWREFATPQLTTLFNAHCINWVITMGQMPLIRRHASSAKHWVITELFDIVSGSRQGEIELPLEGCLSWENFWASSAQQLLYADSCWRRLLCPKKSPGLFGL